MPSKIQKLEVRMQLSKILRLFVALMVFAVGQNAWAQGFSIGVGVDLPTFVEVRVGYETNDFGVRTYLGLAGLLGADIYAKGALGSSDRGFRLGVGIFTDLSGIAFRGVIGTTWAISPNVVLSYEWRPMYIPSLWADTSGSNPLVTIGYTLARAFTLFSMTFSLEYHF
jgi:hypothetical protein